MGVVEYFCGVLLYPWEAVTILYSTGNYSKGVVRSVLVGHQPHDPILLGVNLSHVNNVRDAEAHESMVKRKNE